MTSSLTFVTGSASQTRRLGYSLGSLLKPGDIVLLVGNFGSGKTTFAQGVGVGLGVETRVTSPSFALVNEHKAKTASTSFPMYHIDLYRIGGASEAIEFGLDEYLRGQGVVLIEWPEQVIPVVQQEAITVTFTVTSARKRQLTFSTDSVRLQGVLASLQSALEPNQRE